jgi:hypothetical protein
MNFDILMAKNLKMAASGIQFCVVRVFTLMMEAVSSSETSLYIYHTTRCYIPEDSHVRLQYFICPEGHDMQKNKE